MFNKTLFFNCKSFFMISWIHLLYNFTIFFDKFVCKKSQFFFLRRKTSVDVLQYISKGLIKNDFPLTEALNDNKNINCRKKYLAEKSKWKKRNKMQNYLVICIMWLMRLYIHIIGKEKKKTFIQYDICLKAWKEMPSKDDGDDYRMLSEFCKWYINRWHKRKV